MEDMGARSNSTKIYQRISGRVPQGISNAMTWLAGAICAVFILAYQSQVLPFFAPYLVERPWFKVIYYCFWAIAVITSAIPLTRRAVFRTVLPVLAFSIACIAVSLLHPVDQITKNFIVAMIFIACASTLAAASDQIFILQMSAAVTAASALLCLIDVFFIQGMSGIAGRGAGLSINPNIAAASLLLGACATYWTIPQRWRGYFLIAISAGIYATLSKSILLAGVVIAVASILAARKLPKIAWWPHLAACVFFAGLIVSALAVNPIFKLATHDAFRGLDGAIAAFDEAEKAIGKAVGSKRLAGGQLNSDEVNALIAEISRRAKSEGEVNSISDRWLLMQRSWLVYNQAPAFGVGFEAAHDLVPHNSFLLSALAVGAIGWPIPLGLIVLSGLPLIRTRDWTYLPLPLAVTAVVMVSHDILFSPAMLAPVVIGSIVQTRSGVVSSEATNGLSESVLA